MPWTPDVLEEGRPPRPLLAREAFYRRYLALGDVIATYAATLMAIVATDATASVSALAGVPVVVLVAKIVGLYDRDGLLLRKTTLEEAPGLFQVATVFTLGTWIIQDTLVGAEEFGAGAAAVLWPLLCILLLVMRAVARRVAKRVTTAERCIVIGDRITAEGLKKSFERSGSVNARIVGRVPVQYGQRQGEDQWGVDLPSSLPRLGEVEALPAILRGHEVDRVLIAPSAGATDTLLDTVRAVKALGVQVSVVPRLFEVVGSSAAFDDVEGTTLLGIRRYGLSRSSRAIKRGMDIAVAVAVLALFSPLLAVIALAIKIDSRGPVLFRQRRIGEGEREFKMIKFRTMTEDADRQKGELEALNEAEGLFKIANDPRITRVGQLLRKTSLDEIPQLINVLRGDMSLVGPRPLVPCDDERIRGWHRRRLHVPPGMTGHWQILGSSRVPLADMVKIDYLYGANWSLWGDLKILLRTVPYVLARRGQ